MERSEFIELTLNKRKPPAKNNSGVSRAEVMHSKISAEGTPLFTYCGSKHFVPDNTTVPETGNFLYTDFGTNYLFITSV